MNNLYRDLAPVTEAAWAEIELEAARTFKRHIAGRRVVDVSDPGGPVTAAVSTGRLIDVKAPTNGVIAHLRASKPLVRLRVPFTLSRNEIDDVERGSKDSDWEPVKEAAKKLAFVEDRTIFEGYSAASIEGIRSASSNPALTLPEDPREIPDVISQALSELRLAGVDGPYSVLLSADVYTKVSETSGQAYYQRLQDAGKTKRAALRCLKRRLARTVFQALRTVHQPSSEHTQPAAACHRSYCSRSCLSG